MGWCIMILVTIRLKAFVQSFFIERNVSRGHLQGLQQVLWKLKYLESSDLCCV